MKILEIQSSVWEKPARYLDSGLGLVRGEWVIIDNEGKEDIGSVLQVLDLETEDENSLSPVKRRANADDLARLPDEDEKARALAIAKDMAERSGLDMKFVDICFSLDRGRINFAFIANGRVDFRSLVKEMIAYFNANIRLTQIGARDEARLSGDCGNCGRPLCCKGCIKNFSSVTSEMAEAQQMAHRGSDRISGMCGRLMCCLSFEFEGYKDMGKELPPIGAKMKARGRQGDVISQNILKHSVNVKLDGGQVVEVKL
jgi:cell fate regulator YaaT (PSP1 superfamily)